MTTQAQIRAATRRAHELMRALDAESERDLSALYRRARDVIDGILAAYAGPDGVLSLQELGRARASIERALRDLSGARAAVFNQALQDAAGLGAAALDGAVRPASAVASRATADALRFVRAFVAADGLQLSDRIWRIDNTTRRGIVEALERAIIEGASADTAARELASRGVQPSPELVAKSRSATTSKIQETVAQELTGANYNAQRLMRTEINRAHGEAFAARAENAEGFAGLRYLLSSAHPEPDICDLLAEMNLYGLGRGVYPSRELCPWPAHPNTLSFLEAVFADEIKPEDRQPETAREALGRLAPDVQEAVLKHKMARQFGL